MKTRTPDLLGMSYACANMVHSPGYADDLRQYTSLNNVDPKTYSLFQMYRIWVLQDSKAVKSRPANCCENLRPDFLLHRSRMPGHLQEW